MALSWDALAPYNGIVRTDIIEPRDYQINIIRSVYSGKNSLVVLPTGLGKTLIAVFAAAKALSEGKKAAILAPTKPLSEQHYQSMSKLLNIDSEGVLLLTGSIGAAKRQGLVSGARVIAATPQTLANDIKSGRLSINDFGVIIFDECHRAVGRYAYTFLADTANEENVQMIGLTASPGSNRKRIEALATALGIENIEIRTSTDPDVVPYVMGKYVHVVRVDTGPVIREVMAAIKPVIELHLTKLYGLGLSPFKGIDNVPKGRLLQIGDNISKIQAQNYKFGALYHYIYVLNLLHAYDLAASEGLYPFISYMDGLRARPKKSKSVTSLLSNPEVVRATAAAANAINEGVEHPKVMELIRILKSQPGSSTIVFAQYRSTIKRIVEMLRAHGITARAFVGKKEGVTHEQQEGVINEFRDGKFRVLVATSIGEEGLDIPSVDTVVFYEPVPNEIRNIQRGGRAGRMRFGEIFILVARDTKDEIYLVISRARENKMRELVYKLKRDIESGRFSSRPAKAAGQQILF
ncbi:MAG: DEAD/DEAH box helicase [Candidatus Micrarchaeota archaeon]|nr:DEAD/DEAH box helicase [Candidatus Micrarchaeota archaeon]